jgi:hypothetical protein
VVHNTLNGMAHIKTESSGEGVNRAVTVKYVGGPAEAAKPAEKPAPKAEVAPEVAKAPEAEAPKADVAPETPADPKEDK